MLKGEVEETVESQEDRLQARRVCDTQRRNESYQTICTFIETFQSSFYFNVQLSMNYAHLSLALLVTASIV